MSSSEGQSRAPLPYGSLQKLAAQKEEEWREVQKLRVQSLKAAFDESDEQLCAEKARFAKLKEDFKYNLKLLSERDDELERYDAMFAELKASFQSRDAEVSELKIKIDELQRLASLEDQARDELQAHYQGRLREKQHEIDQYRVTKEAELQKEQEVLEGIKRSLQRQLRETEDELDIQRRELTAGFDEAMRRREHEMRTQRNEMSAVVLAHEMKVKLLSKELDLARSASQKASDELTTADQSTHELEKKLKQKEWELNDTKGLKDARISELEEQAHQLQLSVDRAMEEFQRKHKTLDRYAREKENIVMATKESHAQAERKLQEKIRELQASAEAGEVDRRRLEWEHQDAIKEKDLVFEKLQRELQDVRDHSNVQLAKSSQDTVDKDLEIERLRGTEDKLKAELALKNEDISRYKKELSLAIEREASLERSKTQSDLDWQRRCEDMERKQYEKSEQLIDKLTQARDQALASLKECKRELGQRDNLISVLNRDRDHAMATLRRHNLHVDKGILPSNDNADDQEHSASQQIQALQGQNETLRSVIHRMRQDMEQLNDENTEDMRKGVEPEGQQSISEEYVQVLEKESRELKVKIRHLEEKVESGKQRLEDSVNATEQVASDDRSIPVGVDNAYLKSHIQSLHDTIGALRAEKLSVVAQLKKQQARITHLEGMLAHVQQQPREKQTEIDQLQYELTTQSRRHATEALTLRQRIAELELNVAETRREADEYFKGGLQTNLEATSLGNQLSALKMDLASKHPHTNRTLDAFVRQLQEEVQTLRRQLAISRHPCHRCQHGNHHDTDKHSAQLNAKLKSAARHIGQLARERHQLIEMGNRLRSELAKYTEKHLDGNRLNVNGEMEKIAGDVHGGGLGDGRGSTVGKLANQFSNKLNKLEKLQYALTKQEKEKQGKLQMRAAEERELNDAKKKLEQTCQSLTSDADKQAEQKSNFITLLAKSNVLRKKAKQMEGNIKKQKNVELQYAQHRLEQDQADTDIIQVQLSSASSSESQPEPVKGPITQGSQPFQYSVSPTENPTHTSHDAMHQTGSTSSSRESGNQQGPLMMSSSSLANRMVTPLMMSSYGEESLQEVWRLLEEGHSPSPRATDYRQAVPDHDLAPAQSIPDPHHPTVLEIQGLQVAGKSSNIAAKQITQRLPVSSTVVRNPQKKAKTKPKIRNWNDTNNVR